MIYVYNETDQPQWEILEKNNSFFHIGIPDTYFGIDILKNNTTIKDYDADILSVISSKYLQMVSTLAYSVFTNNKSGYPSLKPVDAPNEYSSDLYLLTYKIPEGLKVIKEKTNKFITQYVSVDYKHGILSIIATAKPIFKPSYFITLSDEKRTKYITKDLATDTKTSIVNIYIKEYTREQAEASKHKKYVLEESKYEILKNAKSKHPYSLIVYPFSKPEVKETCEKVFHRHPDHTIYINSEDKAIYSLLKAKRNEKYNAATFFVDKPAAQIKESGLEKKVCVDEKLIRMFRNVNYISNDMKIVF